MNVWGLARTSVSSGVGRATAMRLPRVVVLSRQAAPQRRASSSTQRKPTLWRVSANSGPGLPSPTTSRVRAGSLGSRSWESRVGNWDLRKLSKRRQIPNPNSWLPSVCVAIANHGRERLEQNLDVERQRPGLDVEQVIFGPLDHAGLAAQTIDL